MIAALDAHLKTLTEAQKMQHAQERHRMDVADTALGIAAAAASHQTKTQKTERPDG